MYEIHTLIQESRCYIGVQEIFRKCYIDILKLKEVRTIGVNTMGTKAGGKPSEGVPIEKGLTILEEANVKVLEEVLLPRDDC